MECTEPRMLYNGKTGPHKIFLRKCKYKITVRVVVLWYSTAYRTYVGCKSLFELTKDTSYFSLTGELCGAYDEELGEIKSMMTSSNGNIFHVTGHLCGEFTGHRWIPRTKANDGGTLMFSLIWAWINGWVNNREAGDLRCHHAHYDVTAMVLHMTAPQHHSKILSIWWEQFQGSYWSLTCKGGKNVWFNSLRPGQMLLRAKNIFQLSSISLILYIFTDISLGHVNGLVQERRNSIANALGSRLSCTNLAMG